MSMAGTPDEITLLLNSSVDVLRARREGQELAAQLGMNAIEVIKVATAISEIACNAVVHAQAARIVLRLRQDGKKRGLTVVVEDQGPGIQDLAAAMRDGFSTVRSLGIGLPAAKRSMDEFDIVSEVGKGTTITMTKWKE